MARKDPEADRLYKRNYQRQRRRDHPELAPKERVERKAQRRVLIEMFKDVPCARCAQRFPSYCMDFHHRDPSSKEINGALLWNCSVARLLKEVEKCDVLCANCHRARHHEENYGG